MKGQTYSQLWAEKFDTDASGSVTRYFNNKTMIVEMALVKIGFWDESEESSTKHHWAQFGIIQVVSEKGVENFDPPVRFLYRRGVSSITFYVEVYRAEAVGRALINIWS